MSVDFESLYNADLIVDEVYEGGKKGDLSDEVLSKLLTVGNSGGFRVRGSKTNFDLRYVVLFYTGEDTEWVDNLDVETGEFIYFGDNKSPGKTLHDTRNKKRGNFILRDTFDYYHKGERDKIPPFFVFSKEIGRNMRFRGLAVPGYPGLSFHDDLVAVWSIKDGSRFQNYKSIFTILDIPVIKREWINDLLDRKSLNSKHAPKVWNEWVTTGKVRPLICKRPRKYRTKVEQLPKSKVDIEIIEVIYNYFKTGQAFEYCAAAIAKFMDTNFLDFDITKKSRDGGVDAYGKYRIGSTKSSIVVEAALEAKRYSMDNGVGVKQTSRLISRLRHRQFGILITTSYVDIQTYKEIIDDEHPIIIISAIDIIDILKDVGYRNKKDVQLWLESNFEPE